MKMIKFTNLNDFFKESLSSNENLDFSSVDQKTEDYILAKCNSISNLCLNLECHNKIGVDFVKSLSCVIAKLIHLQSLTIHLRQNQIQAEGSQRLCSLISNCKQIKYCSLKMNYNYIRNLGVQGMAQSIAKLTNVITLNLDLSNNHIGSQGIKQLCSNLKSLNNLQNLTLLISYNNIQDEGIQALSSEIAKCEQLTALNIDLSKNNINAIGVQGLMALTKLHNLKDLSLYLGWNRVNDGFPQHFITVISNFTNLVSLNLNLDCLEQSDQNYFKILKRKFYKMKRLVDFSFNI
ncbi:hypothetical protein ABPG74_004851 [Tetrahymena malaccensis]